MSLASDSQKRVLAVFAHPDDETLLAGALIAKWASMGRKIDLLCLAPGDDEGLSARLELAAAELGIASVSSLRFRPFASNEPYVRPIPPMLVKSPSQVVVERVAGKMRELAPDIIITHSQYGDYGHPDHALTNRITLRAAAEAAPNAEVHALAWPKNLVRFASRIGSLFGARGESIPEFDFAHELATAPPETEKINVKQFLAIRKRAARHYTNEMATGPRHMRALEASPVWLQSLFLKHTSLSRLR